MVVFSNVINPQGLEPLQFPTKFRSHSGIVVKSDYEWLRNAARTGRNQFNLSLGYAF